MKCQNCNADNRDGAQFCKDCGAKLDIPTTTNNSSQACPQCGSMNRMGAQYCKVCGAGLTTYPSTNSSVSAGNTTQPTTNSSRFKLSSTVNAVVGILAIGFLIVYLGYSAYQKYEKWKEKEKDDTIEVTIWSYGQDIECEVRDFVNIRDDNGTPTAYYLLRGDICRTIGAAEVWQFAGIDADFVHIVTNSARYRPGNKEVISSHPQEGWVNKDKLKPVQK